MKGLLSVLYRKILYKIPLKFLLLLLAIFGLLFASCNADSLISTFSLGCVKNFCNVIQRGATSYNPNTYFFVNLGENSYFSFDNSSISQNMIVRVFYHRINENPFYRNTDINNISDFNSYSRCQSSSSCYVVDGVQLVRPYTYTSNFIMTGFIYFNGTGSCSSQSCPEIDTGSILSGYVSEDLLNSCQIDLNSCQIDLNSCISNTSGFNDLLNNCSNNLNACNLSLSSCLSNNCPTTSGDISWSSLFINDIQHIGGPSIYIGIPEEIERDYSYVDDDMYINVDGYNVDYDKITNIIDTQNYKPTTEDFNYIVFPFSLYLFHD